MASKLRIAFFALVVVLAPVLSFNLGAEMVRSEAVEHAYGYRDVQNVFHWYDWNPDDNNVT